MEQVLSWLKSTKDGRFAEYVSVFQKHEIYGDALLALDGQILKEEMGITAFGTRHALVKAIKELRETNEAVRVE